MEENDPKRHEIETYRIGEGLYGLSLHELEARISAYHAEITRLQAELIKKDQEKQAADRLFGKN
jgi:uncharacterized small protein (DUF1192 family)